MVFCGEVVAHVFCIGGGDGFAFCGKKRDKGAFMKCLQPGNDGGGHDSRAWQIGMVVVAVELVHLLAAHCVIAIGAEVGEIEHGQMQLPADIFGPLGELATACAAFDLVLLRIVIGGQRTGGCRIAKSPVLICGRIFGQSPS